MDDQNLFRIQIENEVFAAAPDFQDLAAYNALTELVRRGFRDGVRRKDIDTNNGFADGVGFEVVDGGFNFGKFGHVLLHSSPVGAGFEVDFQRYVELDSPGH